MKKRTKNIILIIVLLAIVGVSGYFAIGLMQEEKTTLSEKAMVDFQIEDTAAVDKIELIPMQGQPFTLTRKKTGEWVGPNDYCIQQEPVNYMLETFKNVEVKAFPPQEGQDIIKDRMTLEGIKVNIYMNGENSPVKTWIVGSSTQDHYGCYMLLQKGKKQSKEAVITTLPGFHGTLAYRFYADPLKWECTDLFTYNPGDIKKIEVINNEKPHRCFTIEVLGDNLFKAIRAGKNEPFDTNEVRNYLVNYKNIHYENTTVDVSPKQADSMKASTPYIVLSIEDKGGNKQTIKAYRKAPYKGDLYDLEGKLKDYDQDRLWILLEDGRFVRAQYFVFDKLFLGYKHIYNDYSIE